MYWKQGNITKLFEGQLKGFRKQHPLCCKATYYIYALMMKLEIQMVVITNLNGGNYKFPFQKPEKV